MNKSYKDLREELDENIKTLGNIQRHVVSLSRSIRKRGLSLTLKKVLSYVDRVVWSPKYKAWFLIKSAWRQDEDILVRVISVNREGIKKSVIVLHDPDEDFLSIAPQKNAHHDVFEQALREADKYFNLYKLEYDTEHTATHKSST